jgi:hypothetical protein
VTQNARTFLKLGTLVVEVGSTPLKIGRSTSCDLVLDDELSSREHCEVRLDGNRLIVTDLGSRNGVLVNGEPIEREAELRHADCITVGRQQIMVTQQQRAPRDMPTPARGIEYDSEDDGYETRQGSVLDILSGALRNALRSRDIAAAETSAASYFVVVRARARGGVQPHVLAEAIDIGLELAEAARAPSWLDQALEVAAVSRSVLEPKVVDRILEIASAIGKPTRGVESYLRMASARAPGDPGAARLARIG